MTAQLRARPGDRMGGKMHNNSDKREDRARICLTETTAPKGARFNDNADKVKMDKNVLQLTLCSQHVPVFCFLASENVQQWWCAITLRRLSERLIYCRERSVYSSNTKEVGSVERVSMCWASRNLQITWFSVSVWRKFQSEILLPNKESRTWASFSKFKLTCIC